MTGIDRITLAFESGGPRMRLMAHAVVGYPDAAASARILAAMAASGADLVEAQLPFSDPSADGSSIVAANHAALRSGSRTETCLAILEVLHAGLGDPKYRPCPLWRQYVDAGRLGRKSGRGFHAYG